MSVYALFVVVQLLGRMEKEIASSGQCGTGLEWVVSLLKNI
jgi:hypothetical protein